MFIYDDVLRLYISTRPLLISSRVLKAAKTIDPEPRLRWDDHGFVCGVSHDLARKLSEALSIRMLNVREFMQLAQRHPELQSEEFSEWLSDTYEIELEGRNKLPTSKQTPTLLHQYPSGSHLVSSTCSTKIPIARPGWFHLNDIGEDGIPIKPSSSNQPDHWKFWSPESTQHILGAMRGFVSSSGTCSLDLGIPTTAMHSKIMIREIYEKPIAPRASVIDSLWPTYEDLIHSRSTLR